MNVLDKSSLFSFSRRLALRCQSSSFLPVFRFVAHYAHRVMQEIGRVHREAEKAQESTVRPVIHKHGKASYVHPKKPLKRTRTTAEMTPKEKLSLRELDTADDLTVTLTLHEVDPSFSFSGVLQPTRNTVSADGNLSVGIVNCNVFCASSSVHHDASAFGMSDVSFLALHPSTLVPEQYSWFPAGARVPSGPHPRVKEFFSGVKVTARGVLLLSFPYAHVTTLSADTSDALAFTVMFTWHDDWGLVSCIHPTKNCWSVKGNSSVGMVT